MVAASALAHEPDARIAIESLDVAYGNAGLALEDVHLAIDRGEIVTLLGANGAGKTTLQRAVTGLLPHHRGRVVRGAVRIGGTPVHALGPAAIVAAGVAQVLEGRRIFADLTVSENLRSGAFTRRDRRGAARTYASILERFPILAQREHRPAGFLSGGEQQMLAIGRALMAAPKFLLLDEPSLGLAPKIALQIAEVVAEINVREGTGVMLIEQNARLALSIAHRAYVLERGRVVRAGAAADLAADPAIRHVYLGAADA